MFCFRLISRSPSRSTSFHDNINLSFNLAVQENLLSAFHALISLVMWASNFHSRHSNKPSVYVLLTRANLAWILWCDGGLSTQFIALQVHLLLCECDAVKIKLNFFPRSRISARIVVIEALSRLIWFRSSQSLNLFPIKILLAFIYSRCVIRQVFAFHLARFSVCCLVEHRIWYRFLLCAMWKGSEVKLAKGKTQFGVVAGLT